MIAAVQPSGSHALGVTFVRRAYLRPPLIAKLNEYSTRRNVETVNGTACCGGAMFTALFGHLARVRENGINIRGE